MVTIMKKIPRIVLAFLFLFLGNISHAQLANTERGTELNLFFNYLVQHKMFNGAVAVKYNGDLIFKKGYGTGNFETNTPFTPASQTELGSMSKQFTATAIMILWKDGKLQLTDHLNKYFDPPLPYKNITIEELLSHQSGLPAYPGLFDHGWDPKKMATNKDIVTLLRKYHPASLFKPGTQYQYSNLGYILLAQIVNKVSGKPLDQFLKENVFLPFGMSSTGFFAREKIFTMPLYAPGVQWDKDSAKYTRPEYLKGKQYVYYLSGRLGSGRLTSSINDLLKWDSLLYTNAVLPQPIIKEMFKARVPIPDEPYSYGFGWFIKNGDPSTVFHTGSWPGNLTYIRRYTNTRSTIIILNNTSSKYMKDIRNTVDAIVEGRIWAYPKEQK